MNFPVTPVTRAPTTPGAWLRWRGRRAKAGPTRRRPIARWRWRRPLDPEESQTPRSAMGRVAYLRFIRLLLVALTVIVVVVIVIVVVVVVVLLFGRGGGGRFRRGGRGARRRGGGRCRRGGRGARRRGGGRCRRRPRAVPPQHLFGRLAHTSGSSHPDVLAAELVFDRDGLASERSLALGVADVVALEVRRRIHGDWLTVLRGAIQRVAGQGRPSTSVCLVLLELIRRESPLPA